MPRDGYIIKRASPFRVFALTMLLAAGCNLESRLPAQEPPPPDGGTTGVLVLTFKLTSSLLQTLAPDISMQIASYDIVGTGPDSHTFSETSTNGLLKLSGLVPGYWTIAVDARNSEGTIIGHGQTAEPVLIEAGYITDVQITIAPLSGTGTLHLEVTWDAATHPEGATVQSSLLSMSSGTVTDLASNFKLKADRASLNGFELEAGYYLLTLRLYDFETGFQFWGIAEAVRIIAGEATRKKDWDAD
jgi:hypothetical protein